VEERSDGTILYFTYDVDGSLLSMNYNGTEFVYITNIQGDIIELVDITGTSVVKYTYDAWGNIIHQTGGSLAEINPYRYRGYRYDSETGWYYVQSRYYAPTIGRFINADGLLGEVGDPLNHNMYAYCANNPITYTYNPFKLSSKVTDNSHIDVSTTELGSTIFVNGGSNSNGVFHSSGTVNFFYSELAIRIQGDLKKGMLGVFYKASVINIVGKMGYGTKDNYVGLKSVVDIFVGNSEVGLQYKDGQLALMTKVYISLISGRATMDLCFIGNEIEVGLTGYAGGIGGEFEISFDNGEFKFKLGVIAGVGGSFHFRIKLW
jgi:RHS repeat-associated protein